MKTKRVALLLLVGSLIATVCSYAQEPPPYQGGNDAQQGGDQAPPPPPPADAGYDNGAPAPADPAAAGIDYFHDQLSPYGQWVVRPGYGMVWVPNVAYGWRPYTTGHWLYTDQGWAWAADEPWGWAAFHYGRWFYDGDLGWTWVPGYTWAPAWVGWRHGGGYLGWAPLGPAVGFSAGVGLSFGNVVIGAGFYTFVGDRDFLAPHVATFIVPSARNTVIVSNTTFISNYTVVNNRVVNVGVSSQVVAQAVGHPVATVRVATLATAGGPGGHGAFYQPPAIARAARVVPAEFGANLTRQVAVQQQARSFAVANRAVFHPTGATQGGFKGAGGARAFERTTPSTSAGGSHGTSSGGGNGVTSANGSRSYNTRNTGSGPTHGNTRSYRTTGTAPSGGNGNNTSHSAGTKGTQQSGGVGTGGGGNNGAGAGGNNKPETSTGSETKSTQKAGGTKSAPPPPKKTEEKPSGHKPPPGR